MNLVLNVVKLIIIIIMFDFIGFLINERILKFKSKFYVLYGFIFMVSLLQLYAVPFLIMHVNILIMDILFIISLIAIIIFSLVKVDIKKYGLISRIKNTNVLYIVSFLILGLILSALSFTTNDQWLYNSYVLSSLGPNGIFSLCGQTYCDSINYGHFFNSYYLQNAILIHIFHADPLTFVYRIYRFLDAIIIVQALMMFATILENKRKKVFFLSLVGILGFSLFTNHPYDYGENLLLMNGMNGTTWFQIAYPILLLKYVQSKDEKYLLLALPFSFAITTTTYILNIILLVIFKGMNYEITNKVLFMSGYLYFTILVIPTLMTYNFLIAAILSLILIISLLIYKLLSPKILIGTVILLLVFTNILLGTLNRIALYDYSIIPNNIEFLWLIIILLLIYVTRKKINSNVIIYSCLIILFIFLIPQSTESIDENIINNVAKMAVVKSRLRALVPFQLYAIVFVLMLDKKIFYFIGGYASLLCASLLFYNPNGIFLTIPETIKYRNEKFETPILNSDMNQINIFLKTQGYPMSEFYFHETKPALWSNGDIQQMSYMTSLIPNVEIVFEDTEFSEFCTDKAEKCYEMYPKPIFLLEKGEYEYETQGYYIREYENEE